MQVVWKSLGRDEIQLDLVIAQDSIKEVKMQAVGGLEFLRLSQAMKAKLVGPIASIEGPIGKNSSALIWQEVIGKIKSQWQDPIEQEELCHCRQVATRKVDEAIVYGAHNLGEIRKQTSANTGCGTCLADIEKLLKNRL